MTTPPLVPYCIIPLTQGQVAYVSPHRYQELARFKWHAWINPHNGRFYAVRNYVIDGKKTTITMHRQILGLCKGDPLLVDHKDRNRTLDNTDINLRTVPGMVENGRNRGRQKNNTSGYKGVSWDKRRKKWTARIKSDGVYHYLGHFDTKEEAYAAYCAAAIKYHGEFACVA